MQNHITFHDDVKAASKTARVTELFTTEDHTWSVETRRPNRVFDPTWADDSITVHHITDDGMEKGIPDLNFHDLLFLIAQRIDVHEDHLWAVINAIYSARENYDGPDE